MVRPHEWGYTGAETVNLFEPIVQNQDTLWVAELLSIPLVWNGGVPVNLVWQRMNRAIYSSRVRRNGKLDLEK